MLAVDLEYLMSSLPDLRWHQKDDHQMMVKSLLRAYSEPFGNDLDPVDILNLEAEKYLSQGQYRQFVDINLSRIYDKKYRESRNTTLSLFSKFVFYLKNELKAYRLAKTKNDEKYKSSYLNFDRLPSDPLMAEKHLLKLQWDKLDELSTGHFSDFSALIVYKLKLQLLMRWWSFDTDKGYLVFQQSIKTKRDGG